MNGKFNQVGFNGVDVISEIMPPPYTVKGKITYPEKDMSYGFSMLF
tara:strand:- start:505 stop:642 length:138 start_codon:yes stop_codon:yes gene_type:complete